MQKNRLTMGNRKGGGKRIVRFGGGGGGKRTIERALQNQFWRALKVGLVWSVPIPSRKMTGREPGGEIVSEVGVSKTVFG